MLINVKIGETTFHFYPIKMYKDMELAFKAFEYQCKNEGIGRGEENWDLTKEIEMSKVRGNLESMLDMFYNISQEEVKMNKGEITTNGKRKQKDSSPFQTLIESRFNTIE